MRKELTKEDIGELSVILWDYTEWLHKLGYTDTDFYTEEPYAVDRYLKEKKLI
jgi:hypothetical protein